MNFFERLISDHSTNWVFLLASMVLGLLVWLELWWRKRKSGEDHTSLIDSFRSKLAMLSIACRKRAQELDQAALEYVDCKGYEYKMDPITGTKGPAELRDPSPYLNSYKSLLSESNGVRIARSVFQMSSLTFAQHTNLIEFQSSFQSDYQKFIKVFLNSIFGLSKLHDELASYNKAKKLKESLQPWVDEYIEIFRDWASGGAEKDLKIMREVLIQKIIKLNKKKPGSLFENQTNELCYKAENAYEDILRLDALMRKRIRRYAWSYRKAHTILHTIAKGEPVVQKQAVAAQAQGTTSWHKIKAWWHRGKNRQLATAGMALIALVVAAVIWIPKLTAAPVHFKAGHSLAPPNQHDKFHSPNHHHVVLSNALDSFSNTLKLPAVNPVPVSDSLSPAHPNSLNSFNAVSFLQDSINKLKVHIDSSHFYSEYGIDVSHYQGDIDWAAVFQDTTGPKPIRFAIMKSSQGKTIDPYFKKNWESASAYLNKIGAYHFFMFNTDPLEQARFYIQNVDLGKGNIRPIIDVESNCASCFNTGDLTPEQLVQNVKTFLKEVESHFGCKAIIYSGHSYYHTFLKGNFPDNYFWLAEYSKDKQVTEIIKSHVAPSDNEVPLMWQFTPSGSVKGIRSNVDMNYVPGKYVEMILMEL
jgi:lysozyme